MAEPTDYERGYSFTDYQADRPSKPLPGDELDNELDNIATALGETQTALRDVRRADGKLQNGIVGADALNATAVGALIDQSEALMEDVVFVTQMYLGQLPADPDEGRDGAALTEANWYYNTTSNSYRFWNGASWEPLSGTGTMQTYFYVATAGQTIIEGNDANGNAHNALPGAAVLSMNGAVLVYGRDYTIPTAGRIVLAEAAAAGDELTVITFTSLSLTDIGKIQVASYTGDGVTTTFALPGSVVSATNVRVSLDGVHQHRGQYTVSGSTVTLNEAPPLGSAVEAEVYALLPLGSATASQIELDGGNDVQSWVNARPRTLGEFGAAGDGVTDDTAALQSAAAWMLASASNRIEDYSAGNYLITGTITGTGAPRWHTPNATITVAANVAAFSFTAPTAGPYALSADYVTGALTIAYSGAAAPYAGRRFKIVSNALDPANRDEGSNGSKYRQGEQAFAAAGSTASAIALTAPLRFQEAVDRTPTTGDEGLVDAYTVANGARLYLLDDAKVDFNPGTLAYEDGHDADWNAPAVTLTGHGGGVIEMKITRGYAHGLRLFGCYGVEARVDARNLNDNTPIGQTGYGVATAGCLDCNVRVRAVNTRHAYTSSSASQTAGVTNLAIVLGQGRDVGVRVIDAYGGGTDSASPIDTHHESEDALFVRAVADGCVGNGITVRGRNVCHIAPQIRNAGAGALVFTEYSSGDPDDDYYTNGKLERHLTSATIDSPDFVVAGECFDVSAAQLSLTGSGRYVTQNPRWVYCDNAVVRIEGSHAVTVAAGAGTAGQGLIHAKGVAGSSGAAAIIGAALGGATVVIEPGAVVEIDARSAGVVPAGLKTENGGRIVVRGTLRLLLPAGATLLDGAADSIVCEGEGRIEHSIGTAPESPVVLTRGNYERSVASQLVIPAGSRISGDLRLRLDSPASGTVLVIEDNVRIDGHLFFSDPSGTAVNPAITIGQNFSAAGLHVAAAVENTGTLITMAAGFDIGEFRSVNFARPLYLGAASGARGVGGYLGDVEIDTFIRGISANLLNGWRIGNMKAHTRAAGASLTAGHNGLLVQGCSDWSVGTLAVEGSGEHALRIGGSADSAGSNDWTIGLLDASGMGGCVLKINDGNAYAERFSVREVIGLGTYTGTAGRNRELLRLTRARNGHIGKAIARKATGADYSCFGPLAMDFIDGLRIDTIDCQDHAGEAFTIRADQDGSAAGDVENVSIGYMRAVGGSRLIDFSTTANVGEIRVADGYFEQGAELIDVNAAAVFTGPVELRGYAAAGRTITGLSAGQATVDLRLPDGMTLVGDAVSTAQGTRTVTTEPVDPSNVSGAAMGGLTIQAPGGVAAEGLLGAGINFDRPSDSTRRGAAIVAEQTGADAYSVGLSFFSGAGSTSTNQITKHMRLTHNGDLEFLRTGRGPKLTSPDGLSTALLTIDNNARLNLGGAPLVSQLHFASRSAFQAATIPAWCNVWTIEHAGMALRYVRTATAWRTAITSANGVHGIPADVCTAEHYGAVRDGVTNDAAAINAACNAFGHCYLGYGTYAVGDTVDLETQSLFGAGPQATVLRGLSSSLAATSPILSISKSGSIRGLRVEYDSVTGSETRGQRIAIMPYSALAGEGANRAADVSSVYIGKCGTGIGDGGNGCFSTSFRDIWIAEFSHRGLDFYSDGRTGNSYDNIYIGSPSNPHTPVNCLNMEGDEYSSFFGQINLEHTACTGSVARFYGQVGHSINSLHIEGTDLLTANTAIIEVDSALIQLHAINVLHTRQTADNVSLFWLRDPRSQEAQEGASFTSTRQRGRLYVGNLEMRGLADPNTGLYPSYPSGRRGLANIAGWKFVRCADTTRGWDVEVSNVSHHIYPAASNDEPIIRYAPSRYSDAANFTLLRWGRKGPLGGPNENLVTNGDFSAWTATSATATGSAVQGPTGWFAATATGSVAISRQTEGVGLEFREFLRISNVGTSGNYQSVYTDIPKPQRGIGEKMTVSFDARASVAGRRLEQIILEINNPGGSPTYYYNQLVSGVDSQIQFTTDWQRYEVTDAAIPSGAITTWGSSPTFRLVWQITDAGGTRQSQIDIDRVKLEIGAVATHMGA